LLDPGFQDRLDKIFEYSCEQTTLEFNSKPDRKKPGYGEYEIKVLCNVYGGIHREIQKFVRKENFPEFERWAINKIDDYRKSDPSLTKLRETVKASWEKDFKIKNPTL
jgi:hypothetical protein